MTFADPSKASDKQKQLASFSEIKLLFKFLILNLLLKFLII